MSLNFFDWMRNGVKSAVLLGVSDAVEEIGMPTQAEGNEKLSLDFLKNTKTEKLTNSSSKSTSGRKRLGRSLKDIEPSK